MRIPNSFVPKKDFGKNIEELLKAQKKIKNPYALQDLLESCQEFTEKERPMDFGEAYSFGKSLASNINYNKFHLEELSQQIILKKHTYWMGIYFSALANNIITEQDKITLTFDHKLDHLGSYFNKGTLTIAGDTGDFTGIHMEGGKIIVEGNAGYHTGDHMQGGKIIVKGDAGVNTGYLMQGGEIIVKGKIWSISPNFQKGTIIGGSTTLRQA